VFPRPMGGGESRWIINHALRSSKRPHAACRVPRARGFLRRVELSVHSATSSDPNDFLLNLAYVLELDELPGMTESKRSL
jgi:hypothetical protein